MTRDLNRNEKIDLELLIDAAGLESVLMALSEVCGVISLVVATDQQDATRAKRWATMEGAIGCLVPLAGGL